MAPPTREAPSLASTASNFTATVELDPTVEATADLTKPRPALMDRLHFMSADAAQSQKTLGNQMAQRLAHERVVTGDAPLDKSAKPKLPGDKRQAKESGTQEGDTLVAPIDAPTSTPQSRDAPRPAAVVAPPEPAAALGVPAVKPAAPGPASTIADVQSQVTRAADAIPRPASGGFTAAQQAIRAQGFRQANAHATGSDQKKAHGGGGGGRTVLDPTRPPEPDPVPKQTKALAEVAKKRLTEVPPFPPFEATPAPQRHLPRLGMRSLAKDDFLTLKAAPNAVNTAMMQTENEKRLAEREQKHAKEKAGDKKRPGKETEKKIIKPGDDEPKTFDEMRAMLVATPGPEAVKNAAKKKTKDKEIDESIPKYEEPEPPGPIVFGKARKEQLTGALAGLLAETRLTSLDILHLIRPNVFSKVRLGEALEAAFPFIGLAQVTKVETAFREKVAELQKGAGITDVELAKRVDERRQQLIRIRADAAASKSQAEIDAKRDIRDKAKTEVAESAARKEAADAKAGIVKKAAPKVKLPMNVDARRTRLLGYVTKDVADSVLRFKQKGEIRDMTVARMARDYIDACLFAKQQDEYEISTKRADPASANAGAAQHTTEEWLKAETAKAETAKTDQKKRDDAEVVKLQAEVRVAGDAKSDAIRAWAEKLAGKKRTEEQRAADHAIDVAARQKEETAVLTQLDKGKLALGVAHDFDVVDRIAAEVQKGYDRETIIANLHLNSVQTAILDAYMKPPIPGDDRALSGVMAGMRARIQMQMTPEIAPLMEKEILIFHSFDLAGLNQIGGVQTKGFDANTIAQRVHKAVDKMDTDEDEVYDALANLTKIQAQAIRLQYIETYDTTIDADLKGGVVYGMSGNELRRAKTLLSADQKTADAIGYRIALEGNEGAWYHTGLGSGDIEALDKINHGKSIEERQAAENAYNAENDPALRAQLKDVTDEKRRDDIIKGYRDSGKSQLLEDANDSLSTARKKERFAFSVAGDDETADALELRDRLPTPEDMRRLEQQAARSGHAGMGQMLVADRKKIEAIYDRIRREATARGDREGWTSTQIEAEIARRTHKIESIFDSKFTADYEGKTGQGGLRTAFEFGFRKHDDEKNLANALADNDTAKMDAAKIHVEHRGVYADDDIENAVLASQYQRALADKRRDEMPLRRIVMAREMVQLEKDTRAAAFRKAKDRGTKDNPVSDEEAEKEAKSAWDGKKQWAARERMQRDIDRTLEKAAVEQAAGNMNALRLAYKRDYGGDLDEVVKSDTSGYSGDKAELLLQQNGQLTLGQTMFYAIRGSGTDEAALDTLKGHTAAEIDVARKEFKDLAIAEQSTARGILNRVWDGPDVDQTNMDTEIAADISGRTGFDVAQMLKGEPETIDDKRQRLLEAIDWENDAGPLGRALTGTQSTALDNQLARLDVTIRKLEDPNLTAAQREVYIGFFDQGVQTIDAGIAAHREMLDTWTDRITTAVGFVVGVAVTILTFGAAGIVLAAVLGSIMATMATIALKAAILGPAYGWEDLGTDIVVGIVDAVAAALTAGMGAKLLGAAKSAAGPVASKLAVGKAIQKSLGVGGRLALINPAESALSRALPTSQLLKDMVERGGLSKLLAVAMAEGAENLIANTPSALATNLLDENNYKQGNVVGNILSGTIHQAAQGAGMGLAMKAGMHAGKSAREFGGAVFDAFREPHAPELHHFAKAREQFPDITYEEFSRLRAAADLEIKARSAEVSEHPPSEPDMRSESVRETPGDAAAGERSTERRPLPMADADITTPRQLTEAHARELVPASLRDKLTVKIDPGLAAGTVKVERVMRLGVVVDVKLVVGPHVRPIDVMMHGETVHAMQRYLGVTGAVVRAIERMRSVIVRDGLPPFGTKAWESMHELNKLPRIIEQRLEMLRTGALDPHAEAVIHADIERLAKQVDEHRASFESGDRSKGAGYIAMKGGEFPVAPPPLTERKIPRGERANPSHKRFLAENSALQKKFPGATFLSVGAPWLEVKTTGSRTYRILEVRRGNGDLVARREEILQAVDRNGTPVERWVQRGSEGNVTGEIAERAFGSQFEADQASGLRKNQILLPSDKIQRGGGQGFDGVILEFNGKEVTIILVEVKNYPGRYVPLLDITAIRENLTDNLSRLKEQLRDPAQARALGLDPTQAAQARAAITKNRLEFELQLGDTTHVGDTRNKNSSVVRELRKDIAAELGIGLRALPRDSVRSANIGESHMKGAKEFIEARERLATDKKGHLTEQGVRNAEAALTAKRQPGLIIEPLERGDKPHTFVDARNNRFVIVAPEATKLPAQVAADAAQSLRATRTLPGNPTRIIIDVSDMSIAQQRELRSTLTSLANKVPKLDLQRVVVVNVASNSANPLSALPR